MPEKFAIGATLQLALRETRGIITDPRTLAVFGIIVSVFAITGPFGTREQLGFIERLSFWLVAQAMSWTVAIFSIRLADIAFGSRLEPAALRIGVTGAVAGVPVSLASLAFDGMPWRDGATLDIATVTATFATSIALTIAFSALCQLALRSDTAPPLSTGVIAESSPAAPAILARMPLEKRGPLIRLSAADHYVEVTTGHGKCLLLMRLADAIAETEPVEGMQIHRSHWVALDAVTRVGPEGSRMVAVMIDGFSVPVSRAQAKHLRNRVEARRK
ncbi:MAG: LytTR family transcriptional regulator [Rhizobiaceae bacterium]|nr:LytTR family transcriptional regulator [Rhizobiaceae bacterium]